MLLVGLVGCCRFEDLDIELEARPGIFEAFGADADGHLGVSELVPTPQLGSTLESTCQSGRMYMLLYGI